MASTGRVVLWGEYPIEKMFRDARASMIGDGVNDALSIKAMEYL